ncbi:MAG: response regulator [Candidatus Eisenbacteria bacterium]|uniref:Response regulator n=1 Tax=Eiseniibacteriota bacterium TaxID=2212470 RepID=A0A948W6M3_UNCEI|nr:response regulator [Candidatus Eisenbacteria bacterium]MBU1948394.1 response regulator [Candidatus Eisenbacteria bacterium]MBU2691285.1 response regulator [Candidatus Eisenbacteria bacterium]
MQIAVVDNDKALLRSLAIVLGGKGRHITCFDGPQSAAQVIGVTLQPDLLIIDYLMPGCDGIELLLRVRPYLTKKCSIIMISGHTEMLDQRRIKELNLSGFIPKPIDLNELYNIVAQEERARRRNHESN